MQKFTFAPETIDLLRQRLESGSPGFQPGDEVSYITSFTTSGTAEGSGGYVSFYIPDGAIVAGAAIVEPDGNGGFVQVPPRLPGEINGGWGDVGNTSFVGDATWTTSDPDTIAACAAAGYASVELCPGTLAQAYVDTGVFYSNDSRTEFFAHPTIDNPDALRATDDNGYNINPSIGSPVDAHNLWDALQVEAFSGTASPTDHHTPALNFGNSRGNTPYNTGAAVAGPDSGYKLDHTGLVGPWKRAQYLGSRVGMPSGPAVNADEEYNNPNIGAFVVMGEPTSAGTPFPLPSDTNHVRIAIGQLFDGETNYAKLTLQLGSNSGDEATAFLVNASVVGGDAGGISNGKDAIWRYFQPSVAVSAAQLLVTKTAASDFVQPGETVNYTIFVENTGFWDASNVVVTDTLPDLNFSYGNTTNTVLHKLDGSTVTLAPTITPSGQVIDWNFGTLPMESGEYLTIEFDAAISVSAPTGDTLYANTVAASYFDRIDAVTTGPVSTAPVQIVENLFTSKTVTPTNAEPGDTVTYQISLENVAADPITDIQVSELLPTDGGSDATTRFSYVANSSNVTGATAFSGGNAATPTVSQVAGNQEEVVWDFGSSRTLLSGESFIIEFQSSLGTGVSDTDYLNDFSIDYTVNGQPLSTQKTDLAPVTVKSPLQLSKTVNPAIITADEEVSYTIILENTGVSTLDNIVVQEFLPFDGNVDDVKKRFEYVANSTTMAGSGVASIEPTTGLINGNQRQLTWNLGSATLAPGAQATITFSAKVGEEVTPSSTAGDYPNTFEASYNKGAITLTASKTDVTPVTVLPLPPLKLSKEVIASSGNTTTYQITAENRSLTDTLEKVIVYEFLPTTGGLVDIPSGRFNYLPTLDPNDELAIVTGTNNTIDKREVQVPAQEEGYDDVNREQISWAMTEDMAPGDKFTLTFEAKTGDEMPTATYTNALRGAYEVVNGDPGLTDIFSTAPVQIVSGINGAIFQDYGSATTSNDGNGVKDDGELAIGDVTTNLYQNWTDANSDGLIDTGEATLVGTTISNADNNDTIPDGDFRFTVVETGTYYIQPDLADPELGGLAYAGTVTPLVVIVDSEESFPVPFNRPLVFSKTVDLSTVQASGEVTYTIAAENRGPDALESVKLYEFLPTSDNQVEDIETRFSYVASSTTEASGNSVALKNVEPNSRVGPDQDPYQDEDNREQLLWELDGDLPSGELVEFSFRARVGNIVTTGTYPNDLKAAYTIAIGDVDADLIDTAPVTVNGASKISGTVFEDFGVAAISEDNDAQDSGELGIGAVTINLYEDTNGSGNFESGIDQFREAMESNSDTGDTIPDGSYRAIVPNGTYFVEVDVADQDLEGLVYGGTTTPITVVVTGGEETADFPFDPALQVVKTVSPATASAGDEVTYTITLTNNGPDLLETVKLYEFLPTSDSLVENTATRFSYVANSTIASPTNSVALKNDEPTINIGPDQAPYNGEDNREQLLWELDDKLPIGGQVEFSFRAIIGASVPENTYDNDLRALYKLGSNRIVNVIDTAPVTLGLVRSPQMTFVKRVTAIGNTPITSVVNDPSTTDDDHAFWPTPLDGSSGISTFLVGDITRSDVLPGDELEYTIYFMSSGNVPVTNANVCDVVPENTTYVNGSTKLKFGGDTVASGAGQLLADGSTAPCPSVTGAARPVVVVNLADNATGETLPPLTGPGIPSGSYGYVRFRVTVD
ncbi:DUF11 domain-containing protein [Leptolyngbya cf. ectocarpi LEGE 11479]|uniref:DUF11 domain-containing protein n=1 Tax=Leptolyngbya cf. ectocarpi LEGE 11479 TaxID=1828722 RepID=A0A928X2Z3_LEPEC|nr:DUF11 domain-containing protein [Leptolyngbya ectocarpi]MBE9066391.1 DUF11 domain-containing protein [Leptolyngbya cf. ectocarpi LEGE 11479]